MDAAGPEVTLEEVEAAREAVSALSELDRLRLVDELRKVDDVTYAVERETRND